MNGKTRDYAVLERLLGANACHSGTRNHCRLLLNHSPNLISNLGKSVNCKHSVTNELKWTMLSMQRSTFRFQDHKALGNGNRTIDTRQSPQLIYVAEVGAPHLARAGHVCTIESAVLNCGNDMSAANLLPQARHLAEESWRMNQIRTRFGS